MNKSLRREEMKALKPMRRTLTVDRKGNLLKSPKVVVLLSYHHEELNRAQRRRMDKIDNFSTGVENNRKTTRGRIVQYADVMAKEHRLFGTVLVATGKIRKIIHRAFHNFFK